MPMAVPAALRPEAWGCWLLPGLPQPCLGRHRPQAWPPWPVLVRLLGAPLVPTVGLGTPMAVPAALRPEAWGCGHCQGLPSHTHGWPRPQAWPPRAVAVGPGGTTAVQARHPGPMPQPYPPQALGSPGLRPWQPALGGWAWHGPSAEAWYCRGARAKGAPATWAGRGPAHVLALLAPPCGPSRWPSPATVLCRRTTAARDTGSQGGPAGHPGIPGSRTSCGAGTAGTHALRGCCPRTRRSRAARRYGGCTTGCAA